MYVVTPKVLSTSDCTIVPKVKITFPEQHYRCTWNEEHLWKLIASEMKHTDHVTCSLLVWRDRLCCDHRLISKEGNNINK